jgi:hypothetical protein
LIASMGYMTVCSYTSMVRIVRQVKDIESILLGAISQATRDVG